MTININPNAAHAVYSMSSAPRWSPEDGCSASASAIAALGEQEEGEAAAKGTAAHTELERRLGKLNGEFVDPAAMTIAPADDDHPSAVGVARAVNFFRQLPPGRVWIEQRVALTDQIWGRADLQHWHAETATLTTLDLKDGFVGVDPDSEQLRLYGAAGMSTYKLPVKWFRNVVCQENDFRPVPRVKQSVEDVASLYAFAERVAAIPASPLVFRAGEQCTYCPLFGRCEASRDMLRNIGALVAGLMTADQVPLAQRALFLSCEKPVTDAFKNASKAWSKEALKGAIPPGMKIVESQKHRAWINEAAARAAVIAAKGVDALKPPTPAQAEELGVDVSALATKPDGGPALAFESDKRPEWKARTASEMFAGVIGAPKA